MLRYSVALSLWLASLMASGQPGNPRPDPVDAALFQANSADPASQAADPLDDYLYQAFAAATHGQRQAIYHLGIQGRMEYQGYRLTAVLEGYPAHGAGLRRGDVIVSAYGVDFHPIDSLTPGRPAPLTIVRNGTELEVTLTPVWENLFDSYRQAVLNSVQQFSVGNKVVGYLRLWGMSRATGDLINLHRMLQELDQTDGLILDLRDGYGFFGAEHLAMFRGSGSADFYRKPIALLLNERTRGGLQTLAQQLLDLQRVITIGTIVSGNENLVPEVEVAHPLTESSRNDPVYQTAVNVLLGVI